MKKIVVVLIILVSFVVVNAQKDYQTAFQYYKWKEFDNAKTAIDKAVLVDGSKDEPKTWYLKGVIYHNLLTSKDQNYQKLVPPNCENVILESYKKALLLDFKDVKYHNLDIQNNEADQATFIKLLNDPNTKYIDEEVYGNIMTQFSALANLFYNNGAKQYKDKDFNKAMINFENSLFISGLSGKVDTAIMYFAAISADSAKNYKKSNGFYKQITFYKYGKNNIEKAYFWVQYANSYIKQGDTTNYLKTLKTGIEKNPTASAPLLIEIINYYIKSQKIPDAINYINVAIEKDPKNPNLLFSQGNLYEKIDSTEKAVLCYKKVIALDSTKTDPLYSLGSCYFNKGVEYSKQASDLPTDDKNEAKYKELTKKSEECFKNALPYLEKAKAINSKDIDILNGLKGCYYKLKMYDKSDAIKKEIDALIKK